MVYGKCRLVLSLLGPWNAFGQARIDTDVSISVGVNEGVAIGIGSCIGMGMGMEWV